MEIKLFQNKKLSLTIKKADNLRDNREWSSAVLEYKKALSLAKKRK